MDGKRNLLLQCLDQAGFRTGTEIGARLGLTRAAVHKHVRALVEQGVPIHRVPGRGYRLADGVSLLDVHSIRRQLSNRAQALLSGIDVLEELDSTSAELARQTNAEPFHCRVCLAEKQTAGRGRRGRSWVASPYRDLMFSIGIEYPQWPNDLPTLGLVTALTLVKAMAGLGVRGLMVKWPNDVVHEHGKVCGVLLDVSGEAHGPCRVIVGVGVNVSMCGEMARAIDQRWTDLKTIAGQAPDRNTLAATCLNHLLPVFQGFPARGFAAYRAQWRRLDVLRDRWVMVRSADGGRAEGRAAGVDESGRLKVTNADGGSRVFTQGDVSVQFQ